MKWIYKILVVAVLVISGWQIQLYGEESTDVKEDLPGTAIIDTPIVTPDPSIKEHDDLVNLAISTYNKCPDKSKAKKVLSKYNLGKIGDVKTLDSAHIQEIIKELKKIPTPEDGLTKQFNAEYGELSDANKIQVSEYLKNELKSSTKKFSSLSKDKKKQVLDYIQLLVVPPVVPPVVLPVVPPVVPSVVPPADSIDNKPFSINYWVLYIPLFLTILGIVGCWLLISKRLSSLDATISRLKIDAGKIQPGDYVVKVKFDNLLERYTKDIGELRRLISEGQKTKKEHVEDINETKEQKKEPDKQPDKQPETNDTVSYPVDYNRDKNVLELAKSQNCMLYIKNSKCYLADDILDNQHPEHTLKMTLNNVYTFTGEGITKYRIDTPASVAQIQNDIWNIIEKGQISCL